MFPIPFNFPFRKKDGSIITMDAAIAGGGTPYELPTASESTKGGVKVGSGLSITNEVLSANAQVPAHTETDAGKVLTVGEGGALEWDDKGGAGGGFIDARTLEHDNAVISGATYNYYIIDVHDIDSIIVIGAYGVSGLKSSYRYSRYYACVNYPPTSGDFTTLAGLVGAPNQGELNALKFDTTNYNYVLASDNAGVGYSDQNFAGYCPVTPYTA